MFKTKIYNILLILEVRRSWKKQRNCMSDLQIHSKWQRSGEVRSGSVYSVRVGNMIKKTYLLKMWHDKIILQKLENVLKSQPSFTRLWKTITGLPMTMLRQQNVIRRLMDMVCNHSFSSFISCCSVFAVPSYLSFSCWKCLLSICTAASSFE